MKETTLCYVVRVEVCGNSELYTFDNSDEAYEFMIDNLFTFCELTFPFNKKIRNNLFETLKKSYEKQYLTDMSFGVECDTLKMQARQKEIEW